MERAVLAVPVVFPFSVIVGQLRAEACSRTAITATRRSEPRYTSRCSSHGCFRWPQISAPAMMRSMEKTAMSIQKLVILGYVFCESRSLMTRIACFCVSLLHILTHTFHFLRQPRFLPSSVPERKFLRV